MTFPDWTPEEAIELWRNIKEQADSEANQYPECEPDRSMQYAFERLLTYPDMQTVWKRLPKHNIDAGWFCLIVKLSWMGPVHKISRLTPKQYRKWLSLVQTTSSELARLIVGTSADECLSFDYDKAYKTAIDEYSLKTNGKPPAESKNSSSKADGYINWPNFRPEHLSTILRDFHKYPLTSTTIKTARTLGDLIVGSHFDYYFKNKNARKRSQANAAAQLSMVMQKFGFDNPIDKSAAPGGWPNLNPGKITSALNAISECESDEDFAFLPSQVRAELGRPNSTYAHRAFFIRTLTGHFINIAETPLREIVAITAGTMFDDPNITERQIFRLAPIY